MRKKMTLDEAFQEGEVVEAWSRKRISIALGVLVLIGIGGFYLLGKAGSKAVQVLGTETGPKIISNSAQSTSQDIKLPTKEDANMLLEQAKQELSNLTSENVGASQAGILQKVVEDLQNIKSGSNSGAVGVFCDLVCKK